MASPPAHAYILALPSDFSRFLEDGLTREDSQGFSEPLAADDTLLVNEEERPPGRRHLQVLQPRVLLNHLQIWEVAQERIWQLERVRERLLREGAISTDPENLDVQVLELAVVDLPSRQVLRSDGLEIDSIELEQDRLLPSELT
jgi:hypothetical protein